MCITNLSSWTVGSLTWFAKLFALGDKSSHSLLVFLCFKIQRKGLNTALGRNWSTLKIMYKPKSWSGDEERNPNLMTTYYLQKCARCLLQDWQSLVSCHFYLPFSHVSGYSITRTSPWRPICTVYPALLKRFHLLKMIGNEHDGL